MTKEKCEEYLKKALSNPVSRSQQEVKKMYDEAMAHEPPCLSQKPTCECCCPKGKKRMGTHNAKTRRVAVCYNAPLQSAANKVYQTLKHELQHALDLCGKPEENCDQCMRSEKRAYARASAYLRQAATSRYVDRELTTQAWQSCKRRTICDGHNGAEWLDKHRDFDAPYDAPYPERQ